jgi:hypothetical protein
MMLLHSIRWDLLVPFLIVAAVAVGQSSLTRREIRTGHVAWWAKVKWPGKIRLDYTDPANFRARQIGNVVMSAAAIALSVFLLIKLLRY